MHCLAKEEDTLIERSFVYFHSFIQMIELFSCFFGGLNRIVFHLFFSSSGSILGSGVCLNLGCGGGFLTVPTVGSVQMIVESLPEFVPRDLPIGR